MVIDKPNKVTPKAKRTLSPAEQRAHLVRVLMSKEPRRTPPILYPMPGFDKVPPIAPAPAPQRPPAPPSPSKAITKWLSTSRITVRRAGFTIAELAAAVPPAVRADAADKSVRMILAHALRRHGGFEKIGDGRWRPCSASVLIGPREARSASGRRRVSRKGARSATNSLPRPARILAVCVRSGRGAAPALSGR
jgi:hypothetical protein